MNASVKIGSVWTTGRFTEWLREGTREAWEAATEHHFTRDVRQDTLPETALCTYLVQEYAFVRTSAAALGYAIAKAPTIEAQAHLAKALVGLTGDQERFFRRSFRTLGLENEAQEAILPSGVKAFRDFVVRVAATGSYEDTLTTMLGAEWLYLTWCQTASLHPPTHPLLLEWVELHVTQDFANGVNWLRQQLDDLGPQLSVKRQAELRGIFQRTLELEVIFHDAAYF